MVQRVQSMSQGIGTEREMVNMIEIDPREAQQLVGELIAIDSVNPSLVLGGAGEQAAAEHILRHLESVGIPGRLDRVAKGRPNVIGVLPPSAEGGCDPFALRHGLMLNGHLDTVGTVAMEEDALKPRFEGDRVYGRGSLDMKGGLVMGLLALDAVKRSGRTLRRSVLFTGVVDEEYASAGTEDVVSRYEADAAVVMEPTALKLHLAHKGFAWATVEISGRAAHGSNYEEGVDAIAKMGRLLVELENLGAHYLRSDGHPLVGKPSIHASLIQGGRELSTYPDHCKLQLERRTLPGEDPAGIAQEMDRICSRLRDADPEFQYKIAVDFTRDAYEVESSDPVVRALGRSWEKVTGTKPEYAGSSGWLDSALLGEAGIPTVIFGPDGAGAHASVEYVLMSSMIEGAEVLAETILHLCGT